MVGLKTRQAENSIQICQNQTKKIPFYIKETNLDEQNWKKGNDSGKLNQNGTLKEKSALLKKYTSAHNWIQMYLKSLDTGIYFAILILCSPISSQRLVLSDSPCPIRHMEEC